MKRGRSISDRYLEEEGGDRLRDLLDCQDPAECFEDAKHEVDHRGVITDTRSAFELDIAPRATPNATKGGSGVQRGDAAASVAVAMARHATMTRPASEGHGAVRA